MDSDSDNDEKCWSIPGNEPSEYHDAIQSSQPVYRINSGGLLSYNPQLQNNANNNSNNWQLTAGHALMSGAEKGFSKFIFFMDTCCSCYDASTKKIIPSSFSLSINQGNNTHDFPGLEFDSGEDAMFWKDSEEVLLTQSEVGSVLRNVVAIDHPFPWEGQPPPVPLFSANYKEYQLSVELFSLLDLRFKEGFFLYDVAIVSPSMEATKASRSTQNSTAPLTSSLLFKLSFHLVSLNTSL